MAALFNLATRHLQTAAFDSYTLSVSLSLLSPPLSPLPGFFIYFIYSCLHWVFFVACGPSPVVACEGYSLVVVCRLLIAVASLAKDDGP